MCIRDRYRITQMVRCSVIWFHAGYLSVHQLMCFCEHSCWSQLLMRTDCCYLSWIKKDFYHVWHSGRLREILLLDFYIHLITSFLWNRTLHVVVNSSLSSERTVSTGVPQWSVLCPLLISMYINNVPKLPETQLAMFTDDTTVYAVDCSAEIAVIRLQEY